MTPNDDSPAGDPDDAICTTCGRWASFNLPYARSAPDSELGRIAASLVFDRTLKVGSAHRCSCGRSWFLDAAGVTMLRIPRDREDAFRAWGTRPLVLSEVHLAALAKIGGAGADKFGNGRGALRFPCRVTLRSGEVLDPALVVITDQPPVGAEGPLVLPGDVAEISPSAYALSAEVRVATLHADETHPGSTPTFVEAPDGRVFVLHGSQDLFGVGLLRGRDLRVAGATREGAAPTPAGRPDVPVSTVVCDWFAGAEVMTLPGAPREETPPAS